MRQTDINVGDIFGDRRVVYKDRYDYHEAYVKARTNRISGVMMVWMLCKCGDLTVVGLSNGFNSITCRLCSDRAKQAALRRSLKYVDDLSAIKRDANLRQRAHKLCTGCRLPSVSLTCDACKNKYLRRRMTSNETG